MSRFSIKARMQRSIALRKGEVVLRADFAQLGSPSQISRALKALQAEGRIVRLGYGVYAKARPSVLSGKPIPRVTLEELAQESHPLFKLFSEYVSQNKDQYTRLEDAMLCKWDCTP